MNRLYRIGDNLAPWFAGLFLLFFWEFATWAFDVPTFIFPGAVSTLTALWQHSSAIGEHAWQTFWTTVVGFAIGVVVGLLLGIMIGTSKFMYRTCYPLLVAFNSIPKVAVVPILVVWFGIGTVPAILTAFLISFFPIVVNVGTGLATVEPELEDVLRVLGARKRDVLVKVGLPRSMPHFFGALKIAITLAFVGTVVAETVASNKGIGYLMITAGSQMRMSLVFAGLLAISAMAMVMYGAMALLEKRFTGWAHRQ